ncbi:hypothetical protein Murru_0490 [Allomuricauda ruestringensis DSM 13258]|uniref:Ig-like domain-containing protein n=1 Tax=Allomuricauda ruestringensis (strain DSM 13258 / CIP 107369 / LMG 19739 / B1) TaxID=886377 RepID=G2PSR7_ALLRU|nr:T9SS type B sorting domain-containing protein [Allomuricauda ruestringensis]AEM69544.1 hypothetical protein Murru_0490 [Allomuricauda ruestringensis DSM 13258]
MRALFSAICCLLFPIAVSAQNSPDCRTAIPVCADAPIMGTTDGSGDIDDFDPEVITQTGCLEKGSVSSANIENNTEWYVFRAGTDGQIGFDIEALPVNSGGTITAEWDFALYGPFDETSNENYCTIIGDGSAQPIRCNYEYNDTGFTGIGVNPVDGREGAPFVKGSQNTYDEWLNVREGEIYYLYINNYNTNFDEEPESFVLTFTGTSVDEDQDSALDCTLRDEFLGFDIVACEGDPDITLSVLNSPFGPNIADVSWVVDREDNGNLEVLPTSPGQTEYVVSSPNSGRYYAIVTNNEGETWDDDVLITFYGTPELDEVRVIDDFVHSDQTDPYNVEIVPVGDGNYEYAINGGEFQDDPIFRDVPPGLNTVVINDKNGCGTSEPEEFLVVGYPKFFTPNSDGFHDNWTVYGVEELANPVVYIFDRYGKLLKQINVNVGWDGTYNGRDMPSSDYWFRLEYERDDEGILVAKSVRRHFSLVR